MCRTARPTATGARNAGPSCYFRRIRHINRNTRLHQQLRHLATADRRCRYLGRSRTAESIAASLGFAPHDMAIANVEIGRRTATVICVPHRMWNNPCARGILADLRFQACSAGLRAVLVSQATIERSSLKSNCQLLSWAASLPVDPNLCMQVLTRLNGSGPTCLSELAGLVRHGDPFGSILALATSGIVGFDVTRAITPVSLVSVGRRIQLISTEDTARVH